MEAKLKFQDPYITAKGDERAHVDLKELRTLWFNTGSLCNLACTNCYIESSPRNDRLAFITKEDILPFLDEIKEKNFPVNLIGLTGGEPFANPHIINLLDLILNRGFETLVLTNAYKVLKRHQNALLVLRDKYPGKLKIRVSLDHYTKEVHEGERGAGTFDETLTSITWLQENKFSPSIAGRSLTHESMVEARKGYENFAEEIVIFPEMDLLPNVPEITTACWNILNKGPNDQMCAHERMVVKKKGKTGMTVMPCTLLAYDEQFELGNNLTDSKKRVQLNHPFCAKFCVLGGASCSPKVAEA
jgi:sulfatase maturation enzyme AslB (radical SAM superfamily)